MAKSRVTKPGNVGKHFFTRYLDKIDSEGLESFGRYYSVYRGFVADNDDPDKLGRVKLMVPDIYGDQVYNYWAYPIGVFAGVNNKKKYGFQIIPRKGDMVWVSFEQGNPELPVWQNGHPGEDDVQSKSELTNKDSFWFISPEGISVVIDDTKKHIYIQHPDGDKFISKGKSISIVSKEVSIGSEDGSDEPAALAKTLVDLLEEMIDAFGQVSAIPVGNLVSSTINSSPVWFKVEAVKAKLSTIKSKSVTING